MTAALVTAFGVLAVANIVLVGLLVWLHVKQVASSDRLLNAVLSKNAGEYKQLQTVRPPEPADRPPATIPSSDAHIARELTDAIRAMQPAGLDGT